MIYYFSGTGNSKYVAEKLAEYTKDSIHFIPTVFDKMEDDLYIQEGEVIGIVFPIYVWAVPEIVQEFLSHVHVHEKAFSYVVCTCGLEAGAALQELKKVFPVKSAYSLIMPENYVVLFKTENDERIREKINIASQKIPKIAQEINSRKEVYDVKEGHASLFKTLALNKIFSLVGMNSAFFSVEDTCTSCGLCEKKMSIRCYTPCEWEALLGRQMSDVHGLYFVLSFEINSVWIFKKSRKICF
ncbi:MAG: flavodoxin family protein [Treponema sp.]|nr:flavodoxin family protein [Treponema sp.]